MLENLALKAQERFDNRPAIRSPRFIDTACDVCNRWEAQVRFNRMKMCGDCAKREEGIEVLG